MISKSKKILMVAGEVSGDLWGSLLAKALLQIDPDLKIFGAGLDKMRQAGISLLLPPEKLIQLSVVGTLENIGKVPALFRLRRLILNSVQQERPRLVILIDFPGFNLNLAKKLQRFNVPLVYYSPPQTWLWGAWRIKKLKKLFKKLLVFFPFEEQFYKNHHLLNVEWVGHPLQEWIGNSPSDWDAEIGESTQGVEFIGILPGSRFGTIRQHLPPMLEAARILHEKNPKRRFLIPLAPSIPKEWISKQLGETGSFVKVLARESHRVLRVCRSAMIGQGTATLEAAFCETPMVLCGKYTAATAVMARLLKVRPQGILHRLAHRSISPELWQREVNGIHIAQAIESILDNEEKYQQDVRELKKIKEIFAAKARPSLNAANAIQNILDGSHDIKILA